MGWTLRLAIHRVDALKGSRLSPWPFRYAPMCSVKKVYTFPDFAGDLARAGGPCLTPKMGGACETGSWLSGDSTSCSPQPSRQRVSDSGPRRRPTRSAASTSRRSRWSARWQRLQDSRWRVRHPRWHRTPCHRHPGRSSSKTIHAGDGCATRISSATSSSTSCCSHSDRTSIVGTSSSTGSCRTTCLCVPTVSLALDLLTNTPQDRLHTLEIFGAEAPLVRHRLISLRTDGDGAPLIAHRIALDIQITAALLRLDSLDRRLATFCRTILPSRGPSDHPGDDSPDFFARTNGQQRDSTDDRVGPLTRLTRQAWGRHPLRLCFSGPPGAVACASPRGSASVSTSRSSWSPPRP